MVTTALKVDPADRQITFRLHAHPEEFQLAFATAGAKLPCRDIRQLALYLGCRVPNEEMTWEDRSQSLTISQSMLLISRDSRLNADASNPR
jgi:catalase (peroxidase I)